MLLRRTSAQVAVGYVANGTPLLAAALGVVALGSAALGVAACGGPAKPPTDAYTAAVADAHAMSLADATKLVNEATGAGTPAAAVTLNSIADAENAIREDRTQSFDEVVRFLEKQPGPAPRAIRGFALVSAGEIHKLVARVIGQQTRRKAGELRRYETREAEGAPMTDDDKAQKEALAADVKKGARLETAFDLVAVPELRDGTEVAADAEKQSPTDKIAPVALAHAYAVTGAWLTFDDALAHVEKSGPIPGVVSYLRAVEQAERYSRPDRARELLARTRAEAPRFVRAQARLVLMQETVDGTAAEMEKLCAEAPYHVLCTLGLGAVRKVKQVESTSTAVPVPAPMPVKP